MQNKLIASLCLVVTFGFAGCSNDSPQQNLPAETLTSDNQDVDGTTGSEPEASQTDDKSGNAESPEAMSTTSSQKNESEEASTNLMANLDEQLAELESPTEARRKYAAYTIRQALADVKKKGLESPAFIPDYLRLVDVEQQDIQREAIEAIVRLEHEPKTALVECWAPWCGPCRMMNPLMEELIEEDYRIRRVNTSERRLSGVYVSHIPTFSVVVKGKEIARRVGVIDKAELLSLIEQLPKDKQKDVILAKPGEGNEQAETKLVAYLVGLLSDDNWVLTNSEAVLRNQYDEIEARLVDVAEDTDRRDFVRGMAVHAMHTLSDDKVSAQIEERCQAFFADPVSGPVLKTSAAIVLANSEQFDQNIIHTLGQYLADGNLFRVRVSALKSLGKIGTEESLDLIAANLEIEEGIFLEPGSVAISENGKLGLKYLPQLFKAVEIWDSKTLQSAITDLCIEVPESGRIVVEQLKNDETRELAASILPELSEPESFADALAPFLKSEDSEIRTPVAKVLSRVPDYTDQVVSILAKELKSEDAWDAISALEQTGLRGIPPLIRVLRSQDEPAEIREGVGRFLANGYDTQRAFARVMSPELMKLDSVSQLWTAVALANSQQAETDLLPLLTPGLEFENDQSRQKVASAIANLNPSEETTSLIFKWLSDEQVGKSFSRYFQNEEYKLSDENLGELKKMLQQKSPSDGVISAAIASMNQHQELIPILLKIARTKPRVASEMAYPLIRIEDEGLKILFDVAGDKSYEVEARRRLLSALSYGRRDLAKYEKALSALLEDEEIQILVASLLSKSDAHREKVLKLLFAGLESEEWDTRSASIDGLRKVSGSEDFFDTILEKIENGEAKIAEKAVEVLAERKDLPEKTYEILYHHILKADKNRRYTPIDILRNNDGGTPSLAKLLQSDDTELLVSILREFTYNEDLSQAIIEQLKNLVTHRDSKVAILASATLINNGVQTDVILENVFSAIESDDRDLKSASFSAIAKTGDRTIELIPKLLELRLNKDSRYQCYKVFENFAKAAPEKAAELLLDPITSDLRNPQRARNACGVIRQLGPLAQSAAPKLIPLLDDERIGTTAAYALEAIGGVDDAVLNKVMKKLEEPLWQQQAVSLMRTVGKEDAKNSAIALAKLKNHADVRLRASVATSIGSLEDESVVPILMEMINDPKISVRTAALYAISRLGEKARSVATDILKLTSQENDRERFVAIQAYIRIADVSESSSQIEKWLADPKTRRATLNGIRGDSQKTKALMSKLIPYLKDPDYALQVVGLMGDIGADAQETLGELKRLRKNATEKWDIRQIDYAIEQIEGEPESNK